MSKANPAYDKIFEILMKEIVPSRKLNLFKLRRLRGQIDALISGEEREKYKKSHVIMEQIETPPLLRIHPELEELIRIETDDKNPEIR